MKRKIKKSVTSIRIKKLEDLKGYRLFVVDTL